jgi:hypothetical protein
MNRFRLLSAALSRSRRRFVQVLAGGALAAVGARHFGWAAAADSAAAGDAGAILSGTEFNLEIGAQPTTPCAAFALARRGCCHAACVQSPVGTDLHPLAWNDCPCRKSGPWFRRSVATEYVLIAAVLSITAVMTSFFSPEV